MRVLGLHGMGTSGGIFASQTALFREYLPPTFTFEFPDAPFPSGPAPGIDAFYPDMNYFSFYPKPTADAVQGAIHWLDEYLEAHGPFDTLMGFSQGCALISSYVMYHEKRQRERKAKGEKPEPLPFKCAMFVCGGIVLDVLQDCGVEVSEKAKEMNRETSRLLGVRTGKLADIAKNPLGWTPGQSLWDNTGDLVHDASDARPGGGTGQIDLKDLFGLDLTDDAVGEVRIGIPTVHVFGKKDPRYPASLQLAYLCNQGRRSMFDHGGGHDIPRTATVSQRLADLMEWLDEERFSP